MNEPLVTWERVVPQKLSLQDQHTLGMTRSTPGQEQARQDPSPSSFHRWGNQVQEGRLHQSLKLHIPAIEHCEPLNNWGRCIRIAPPCRLCSWCTQAARPQLALTWPGSGSPVRLEQPASRLDGRRSRTSSVGARWYGLTSNLPRAGLTVVYHWSDPVRPHRAWTHFQSRLLVPKNYLRKGAPAAASTIVTPHPHPRCDPLHPGSCA